MWFALTFVIILIAGICQSHSILKQIPGIKDGTEESETKAEKWYEEKCGYANVRHGAYLFWWMYFKAQSGRHRPLLLWLQGGPGVSAGYGDIDEIGPLTLNGTERNKTWLRQADLIFIDNPVGAGFSYTTDQSAQTKNLTEIVNDLVSWTKIFFSENPRFRSRKFFIAGQSYGGKVSAAFAKELHHQIEEGNLKINLKGILLVGAWISPMDFLYSYGNYLNAQSRISKTQNKKLTDATTLCDNKANSGMERAQCFGESQMMIMGFEKGVNFYNIKEVSTYEVDVTTFAEMKKSEKFPDEELFALFHANASLMNYYARYYLKMNFAIKQKHGIIPENITWNFHGQSVFDTHLQSDFMTPVVEEVSYLLENTSLTVSVLNGEYDLICNVLGSEAWVEKLEWTDLKNYEQASRKLFYAEPHTKEPAFFKQKYGNFQFFWILKAGHAIPTDAPDAAFNVLNQILHPHLHDTIADLLSSIKPIPL